jgi:hypothetical protein
MGTLNPSFRRPNYIPQGAAHESVVSAIQSHDNSITDLNQAIAVQAGQIAALKTPSTTTSGGATSTTTQVSTENVTNVTVIGGGAVNDQSGVTAYVTTQNDNGDAIIFSDASAIALTLNSGVTIPWYCFILNQGAGTVTATPQQGTINGNSTLAIMGGSWLTIFFDGTNFWAEANGGTSSVVTQLIAGTGISLSPPGGTGVVTLSTSGGSSYSLGGALSSSNGSLGAGAGAGASITGVVGLDGNHYVEILTGSAPISGTTIFTVTFTTSRGHNTYPVFTLTGAYSSLTQIPIPVGGSATQYSLQAGSTALAAITSYVFYVSCP